MFEQRQNTGKRAFLTEEYANAVGQLSDTNDRTTHAEHDLQMERITRQDLIDDEVARLVAEAEERIRKVLKLNLQIRLRGWRNVTKHRTCVSRNWIRKRRTLLRNYAELNNYIDIPEMPLDNNDTERLIRDMVMGKKSYLFCRDLDACKRAAMMYSLFGACKVLDKNPERWLCHVLKNIKTTSKDKLYTLLPEFWEDEEQQK